MIRKSIAKQLLIVTGVALVFIALQTLYYSQSSSAAVSKRPDPTKTATKYIQDPFRDAGKHKSYDADIDTAAGSEEVSLSQENTVDSGSKSSLVSNFYGADKHDSAQTLSLLANKNTVSADFYNTIFSLFEDSKAMFKEMPSISIDAQKFPPVLTRKELLKYIKLDAKVVQVWKKAHSSVYDNLPLEFPADLYKGSGIVFIGGGQYSWLSLLSIKSLRATGSKLPVEVIIPSMEEYELSYCETVLPSLNAKCVMLDNVFHDTVINEWKFKGYQYKSLAIIASSFDNVLLLDSDNIILKNPDSWFETEPYSNHGLILWPDYWKRTTSPHYYDIADITVTPERVRVGQLPYLKLPNQPDDSKPLNLHDSKGAIPDLSTESGQLMIRKSDHSRTVLLSLYYNMFGPKYYYPLFSQGEQGEGDKDTFIAAAVKSKETFYQVKQMLRAFGYFKKNGGFQGVCMGQRDPIEDYIAYKGYIRDLNSANEITKEDMEGKFNFEKVSEAKYFTIHSNFPKLNPFELFKNGDLLDQKQKFRMFGDLEGFIGFDFELKQWERTQYLLCDLNISLKCFNSVSRADLCANIDDQVKFLKETPGV